MAIEDCTQHSGIRWAGRLLGTWEKPAMRMEDGSMTSLRITTSSALKRTRRTRLYSPRWWTRSGPSSTGSRRTKAIRSGPDSRGPPRRVPSAPHLPSARQTPARHVTTAIRTARCSFPTARPMLGAGRLRGTKAGPTRDAR